MSEVQLALSELIGDGGELAAEKAQSEKARQGAEVALLSTEQELQSEIAGKLLEAQLELNITNEKDHRGQGCARPSRHKLPSGRHCLQHSDAHARRSYRAGKTDPGHRTQ
ncbi:hypothetical protein QW131_08305 [Roseibium salinum]|nr:hypothetical protein [Roseibium salinum]